MLCHQAAQTAPQFDDSMIAVSDDECVRRLAMLIEYNDNKNLGEIAALIGRLAVSIE